MSNIFRESNQNLKNFLKPVTKKVLNERYDAAHGELIIKIKKDVILSTKTYNNMLEAIYKKGNSSCRGFQIFENDVKSFKNIDMPDDIAGKAEELFNYVTEFYKGKLKSIPREFKF